MRVLVVEDDPAACENLATGLRAFGGHHVVAASDIASGILKAHSLRFDAAFIDFHFPGRSGIDDLRGFVRSQPGTHVFLMSAYDQQDEIVEALALGAVFVPNRLDVEHLARLLPHESGFRSPELGDGLRPMPRCAADVWAELVARGVLSDDDPRTLEIWCRVAGVSRTVLEERHSAAGIKAYAAKCLVRLLWAIRTAQACGTRPIDMLKADARTAGRILGPLATRNATPLQAVLELQTFVRNPAAVAALARRLGSAST